MAPGMLDGVAFNHILSGALMLRFALAVVLVLLASSPVLAERRVALVVGNGAYANVVPLPNPARDASAIEGLLKKAGFDVVEARRDLGTAELKRTLRDFSERVQTADIAVVFYAGHGVEVGGVNYLIPVDAALKRDIDVEDEAVSLDRVMQLLEPAKRLRLIILDACRDNPFTQTMRRTVATRSIGRGLAKVDIVASDTLVAFAARHGSTAADGDTSNSPYTAALMRHLATPGLDLRLALGRVRDDVLKATKNRQEPFVYGSLGGEEIALVKVTLKPPEPPQVAAQPREPAGVAEPFQILSQSTWKNETCVAEVLPSVVPTAGPSHGRITLGEGPSVIEHINGPDKRCLGQSIRSRLIFYTPTDPWAEFDNVSLQLKSFSGETWGWDCAIRVKDRKAQCKFRK